MSCKVNAVISEFCRVADYESNIKISKFKMVDPLWRFSIQYFMISELLCYVNLKILVLYEGCSKKKVTLWFSQKILIY